MNCEIKINNKTHFVQKFLNPISRISEMCILTVSDSGITSLNKTPDNSIIMYCKNVDISLSGVFERKLNVPDVRKLIKILECIPSESVSLTLNTNNIEYKSDDIKFKFHLIEDGIITPPNINVDKINSFEYDTNFIVDTTVFNNLLKSSSFISDSNKIYLSTKNGTVMAELTDKSKSNIDTYSCCISNAYTGNPIKNEMPFSFDLLRQCSISKNIDSSVSINNHKSIISVDISDDMYKLKYISTALVC